MDDKNVVAEAARSTLQVLFRSSAFVLPFITETEGSEA